MKPTFRILILTPTAFPTVTGNAATTERWKRGLMKHGHAVEVLPAENLESAFLEHRIAAFKPHILHLHHASRAGKIVLELQGKKRKDWALVVSPGGTDINLDVNVKSRQEIIARIFESAAAIIVQSEEIRSRVISSSPSITDKISLIRKSFCWLGEEAFHLRERATCGHENILFFLPAGIRPVKGNLEALYVLEKVHALRPRVRVIFAGPDLDTEYAAKFQQAVDLRRSFAVRIPPIPLEAVRSAYRCADIVLNFSQAEGVSNALMEAGAMGKPILASDIPGNRLPVLGDQEDLPAGLLFDRESPEHFIAQALRLIDDDDLRTTLGQNGRARAIRLPGPEEEARLLTRVYEKAINPQKMC